MTGNMVVFIESYTYLFLCILMLVSFLGGIFFIPGQRRPMLFSAMLSAPFAMTSVFYEPNYWSPSRLYNFGSLGTGLEDIIYTFGGGGAIWLLAFFFWRDRLIISKELKPRWARYCWCLIYSFSATAIAWFLGVGIMSATMVILYAWGLFLLVLQRRLWPVAVWGSVSAMVIHSLLLKWLYIFSPKFSGQWNISELWGLIWGLPIEEPAWALGMGLTWPLFMAYVLDVQVRFDDSALD